MQLVDESHRVPAPGKFWLDDLLCEDQKVFVIAILGVARSGKSSYLNALSHYLSSSCSFVVNAGNERRNCSFATELSFCFSTPKARKRISFAAVELAQVVLVNVR